MSQNTSSIQPGGPSPWACIFVALAIGVLSATSISDAPEIHDKDTRALLHVLSGVAVFVVALVIILTLIQLILGVIGLLARAVGRPSFGIVLTLIVSGTVCMLASLLIVFFGARSLCVSVSNAGGAVSTYPTFMPSVLAFMGFVVGVGFVAVGGVWGSIPPVPPSAVPQGGVSDAAQS